MELGVLIREVGTSMRTRSDDEDGDASCGEDGGYESDPNCISKRELTAKEQKQRTDILKCTVQGARHFCQTTASRVQEDAPYEVFASRTSRDATVDYDLLHSQQWCPPPLEIGKTFEEKDPPVVSNEQLEALWGWVVAHSQFIQEREKRFIATAVAVANNPHLFGYEFGDPQSFVNRMAAFPRNYAHRLIFKHVLRSDLNRHKWKSGINKLLEAAMPKPYDVIYALMCEDNWHNQDRPRDADGRPVHRVPRDAPHARTFNVCHFKKGLQAAIAVPADPNRTDAGLDLYFQDAPSVGSQTGSLSNPREQRELNKLLTGSRKAGKTRGFGVADFPTCGSRQKTSSAHPAERYAAVFDAQGTYSLAEREDILSLFLDTYEDGNTVGRELQKAGDPGSLSKACAVIRRIQLYDPPTPAPASLRRVADAPMQALPKSFRPMGGGKAIRKRSLASTPPNRGSPTSPRHPC